MKKITRSLLVGIGTCLLYACGGGGGGDSPAAPAGGPNPPSANEISTPVQALTGTFLDAAVSDMKYQTTAQGGTASKEGTTNAQGQFNYFAGDSITFSVGKVTLPSAAATGTITPLDLANSSDLGNNVVINILVFLQSLDDDGDPSNGIRIPEKANTAAITKIEFNAGPEVFRANTAFVNLVNSAVSRAPVTVAAALSHFVKTLEANKIAITDPRPVARIAAVTPTPVGRTVVLDGSASVDPKSAALSYAWTLQAPLGSHATLNKATEVSPSFSIDIAGNYLVTLVVRNENLTNIATINVSGVDNIFGSYNLYLYGKDPLNNQQEIYLGCLTCDASQPESICSTDPRSPFGITSSASSIWDVNQIYGDPGSPYSPWDFPGDAVKTPLVHYEKVSDNPNSDAVALFSIDSDIRNLFSKIGGGSTTIDPRTVAFIETLFSKPNTRPSDVQSALCDTSGIGSATGNSTQAPLKKLR